MTNYIVMTDEDSLMVCPKCDGTGRIEPDESGYDGCNLCNYGDGPTGFVTEVIRHGSFGPIVWDVVTGETRFATQDDLDHLPVGPDLTEEEEASIPAT